MALKVELGRKYSAADAKAIVDRLYSIVRERWEVKVNQTPFMQQLMAGKLPLKTLQTFFRNWGAYTIEINTLTACTYHRNITFLKVNRDLMGPIGEKIADEFIHPKPPGHFLVMLQTAQAFGLTRRRSLHHADAVGVSRQDRFHARHRLRRVRRRSGMRR